MRIQLTDTTQVAELLRFLRERGCIAYALEDARDRGVVNRRRRQQGAGQFKNRLADLQAKLDTLCDKEQALDAQLADPAETLDKGALTAVADRLRDTLAAGEPEQTKALLRLLIKELRVNGRSEILPIYRVVTPEVAQRQVQWSAPGSNRRLSRWNAATIARRSGDPAF